MLGSLWERLQGLVARLRAPEPPTPIELDFPDRFRREQPELFDLIWGATREVLAAVEGADFTPLERRSPMLRGFDWDAYIRLSAIRILRLARHARVLMPPGARVLDFGAYFGNFSLAMQRLGFRVDALDAYSSYRGALDGAQALLERAGVRVVDLETVGWQLEQISPGSYDLVICAGVIEHIPHTPRPVLEAIDRVLAPGGTLMLDTPNLAYLYTRERLGRGESIFPAISAQYETEIPFEGHHREYTAAEVEWMLSRIGHKLIALETFNYSLFGQKRLEGIEAERFRRMEEDPSLREVILSVSRKPPVP